MIPKLNSIERRVLGVLMEKAMALPQYYPMTLNGIVVACNQKQNRDPIMDLDEETVWTALDALRARNLVVRVAAGGSSRADKFKHNVAEAFGWQTPQRAILTELLLRGPQTSGELRSRCERLSAFESTEAVGQALSQLGTGDSPAVLQLPRQPGQSAARWCHLLYPDEERPRGDDHPDAPNRVVSAHKQTQAAPVHATTAPAAYSPGSVAAEIAALRAELAALRAEFEEMKARVPASHIPPPA